MTTVAALFDSQIDAQKAIEALAKTPFAADLEFTLIEDADEMVGKSALPGGSGGFAMSQPLAIVRSKVSALEVNDEAENFLRRGVQRGGIIVAVESDDEHVDEVMETMRRYDAQFEDAD